MKKKSAIIKVMRKLAVLLMCGVALPVFSQVMISRIDIEGNSIVSDATIISKIKVRSGQDFNDNIINEDIKNLIGTGFFENVNVNKEETVEGIVVTFQVTEKPVLKEIKYEGTHLIHWRKISRTIQLKEGAFVDEYTLRETAAQIKDMYTKKGFTQTKVSYAMDLTADNEAIVTFSVVEKQIVKIRQVAIEGNKEFSYRRLIRLMKTRPAWLLNRGIFKPDVLSDDSKRLTDFYKLNGFSDVVVETETSSVPKGLKVAVKITEGSRYYIGAIVFEGFDKISLADIEAANELKSGDVFSEQAVYQDSLKVKRLYGDRGYIFARVEPYPFFNLETEKVDVTYRITENNLAYIERIDVAGNLKTKDKVIRRELRIYPGDKFNGAKVRKSKERLENLGFFEEIRFDHEPGSQPNWIDLAVDVTESKTGYLSFGGGYSSIDEFVGFVELRQRNFDFRNWSTFTGAGQDLALIASFGTLSDRYQLSFTNPWIFDYPVSFGFDGYKKGHRREEDVGYGYEQDIRGGALRFGKELTDQIKSGIAYRLESVEITDVVPTATQELKDEVGTSDLSSGELNVSFDTRDNVFVPTKGIYLTNSFQLTGGMFGGDKDFTKYYSRFSTYFPLINKSVVEFRLQAGWADPFGSTEKVPIYQRFFAGGSSSIRGYQERKVGPIDVTTEDPIGGEALFIGNVEYTYPLVDFLKVATFFDTGNVWRKQSDFLSGDLLSSVGLGIRVKTPIGPVSVDYGWPLDNEPGEEGKAGRFHFNISRGF